MGWDRLRDRLRLPFATTRARILLAFAILTAASTALSLFLVHETLTSRLDEEIAFQLTQETTEFRRLALADDPRTGQPFGDDARRIFEVYFSRNVPDEGEVAIGSIGGQVIRSSRAVDTVAPAEVLAAVLATSESGVPASGSIQTSAGRAVFLSVPVTADGRTIGTFVVANLPAQERDEIVDALVVAAQVSGLVLILSFLVAWLVAGRVLSPLRLLGATARRITETDLGQRIPVTGTDEVARLATTFNDMLDRVEKGYDAQRRFLDDAGHELRTPITIARGHLEVLSEDPDERRETIALVTDELDRMARTGQRPSRARPRRGADLPRARARRSRGADG